MTPTTISSSMPWVSTFACPDSPPGEGGGVSATRPELLGRCSSRARNGRVFDGDVSENVLEPECDRFCFFAGCWRSAIEGGERADRGPPGIAMPRDGSESDFRRVLYGILFVAAMQSRWSRNMKEDETSRQAGKLLRPLNGVQQKSVVVAVWTPGMAIGCGTHSQAAACS